MRYVPTVKRYVYIALFLVLGVLVQFMLHALIEIWYIGLLVSNFGRYGLGFTWHEWVMAHHIGSDILLVAGIIVGIQQGRYWWQRIYTVKD